MAGTRFDTAIRRSIVAFSERLVAAWYAPGLTPLTATLLPLSLLFRAVTALRRWAYRQGVLRSIALPVPVVVVGSIVAGGTGKTPLVRALGAALAQQGWRPGIVSRGYGGRNRLPRAVAPGDDPAVVGDEPLLVAADALPVWIGRDRVAVARALLAAHPDCDLIVADDGLQHYALRRNFEIGVIDAARGFGNGRLLPAGPLREARSRLEHVDALVRLTTDVPSPGDGSGRETTMTHEPLPWRNVARPDAVADPALWREGVVHAVAGIGNPPRFFALLHRLGLNPVCHAFPDHHRYVAADLAFPDATAILMTEKDAVKCAAFADGRCWFLPIRARIDPALIARLERTIRGRQAA
ncbi:MAG TPA: tetraacyldisaccharide 4'-kinase [Casimicrobiaceae bacterium]|nr:tetraacyldisaccharide 4'-kinase [Casimicrobiaceae bacterium]